MKKLRFANDAVAGLARLRHLIAEQNARAALRVAAELLLALDKLKVFPEIGLLVEQAPNPKRIRDLFIDRYVVRYLVGDKEVVLLRVWHGKANERNVCSC